MPWNETTCGIISTTLMSILIFLGWFGRDFNVIISDEEKIGGLQLYPQEYEEFSFYMNSFELMDINFKHSIFTWWNGRIDKECIFKRLNRLMVNHWFIRQP